MSFLPVVTWLTTCCYGLQAAHFALHHFSQNADLARFYCSTMKSVAKKSVLRMYDKSCKLTGQIVIVKIITNFIE